MEYDLLVKKLPEGRAYRPTFLWNAPWDAAQAHAAHHEQGHIFLAAPLCDETLRYSRELSVPHNVDAGKLMSHADLVASGMIGLYRSAAIHNGVMQNPARAARQAELQQHMDFACKVSQHQRECRLYAQLPLAEKFQVNAQRRWVRLQENFRDALAGQGAYFSIQEPKKDGFAAHFIENIPLTEAGLAFVSQAHKVVGAMCDPVRVALFEHDFLGLAAPQGDRGEGEQLGLYRYTAKFPGLCS